MKTSTLEKIYRDVKILFGTKEDRTKQEVIDWLQSEYGHCKNKFEARTLMLADLNTDPLSYSWNFSVTGISTEQIKILEKNGKELQWETS